MANLRGTTLLLVTMVVGCNDTNPVAPTPVTPVVESTITVVTETGSGIAGATVTCLDGCNSQQQVNTTDTEGRVTLTGNATLTIRAEKQGYTPAEQSVSDGDRVVLQKGLAEVGITVELPYPQDADVNRGIPRVTVTCTVGCEGLQIKATNSQGAVTFTGVTPLTVQAEKLRHIPVERQVSDGSRVLMGHEWPPETKESIRHLAGMADVIASGKLLLIWGDDKHLPALARETGNQSLGGWIDCSLLIVRKWPDRRKMVWIAIHELMQGWIGLKSHGSTCNPTDEVWVSSEAGAAWVAALERDLNPETGPGLIPGFDDQEYTIANTRRVKLIDLPRHSLAEFYPYWYGVRVLPGGDLCRLAPNRCRYLRNRLR